MTQRQRGIAVAAVMVMAAMLVALVGLTPSADATSYRYWTYWVGGDGNWTFSSQGAARHPADGTVEGWRFAISQAAGSSSTPRVTSSFDDICADTDAVAGKKRVGVVLDFGVKTDAPPGETPPGGPIARCLVLPLTASGYDVLVAATSIRVEKGMVCGIAAYPKTGCGEPVAKPEPTDTDSPGGSGNPPGNGGHHSQPPGYSTTPTPGSTTGPKQGGGSPSDSQSIHPSHQKKDGKPKQNPGDQSQQPKPPSEGDDGAPVQASVALKAPLPSTDSTNSPIGMVVGLAAVAAVSAAAFFAVRRRR